MKLRLIQILEMIRFSHTVFALPFALLAAVMAWTAPWPESAPVAQMPFRLRDLFAIVLCMAFARNTAMAFNRIVDRRIDAQNPRTAQRHLPAGVLSLFSVWIFTVVSGLGFIAGTTMFLPNRLPLFLSVPILAFLCGYSYTKRFTAAAHFWLGAALMLAPLSAWIALRGQLVLIAPLDALPAACLGLGVLLWVSGFDIIYACQDAEFDRQAKLKSVPATIGVQNALRLAGGCHALMICVLAMLPFTASLGGPLLSLGVIYWLALAAVTVLLIVEHWLVRPDDLTRVNMAFFQVNAIVSVGLCLVTSLDLLLV